MIPAVMRNDPCLAVPRITNKNVSRSDCLRHCLGGTSRDAAVHGRLARAVEYARRQDAFGYKFWQLRWGGSLWDPRDPAPASWDPVHGLLRKEDHRVVVAARLQHIL